MNKFEKISARQFAADLSDKCAYDDVKLPVRATKNSAGYDFFAPFDFTLAAGESIKVPTGIRILLDDDKVLMIAPRSGLGFKYRLQLDNTLGRRGRGLFRFGQRRAYFYQNHKRLEGKQNAVG